MRLWDDLCEARRERRLAVNGTVSPEWLRTRATFMSDDWMLRYRAGQIDPHLTVEPDDSRVLWRWPKGRPVPPAILDAARRMRGSV